MPKSKKEGQIGDYWLTQRAGRPSYYRTWFDPQSRQTRRASLGTSDLREAQLRLAEWVSKHARMDNEPVGETLLETVLLRYWEGHAKHIKSARSQRASLRYWSTFFAGAMISELTIERQEQFVGWLRQMKLSPSTVKKVVGVARWALNRAYERQEISAPPSIVRVKEPPRAMRRLDTREVQALVEESRQTPHLHMFVMLALNTLSRPGALLELTRTQCDLDRSLIYLNPPGREQTKKRRPVVPITATLRPYIEACQMGYLVQYRGKPVESIKNAWRKAIKRAGLGGDVVPMTLRRTMARELRRRGVQAWDVAGIMGHRMDERVTEIYAEYDPGYLKQAVEAIDSYMGEVVRVEPRIRLVAQEDRDDG